MANTALASAYVFYIMQELAKGVMNNFANRTNGVLSIGRGAMNFPCLWELHKENLASITFFLYSLQVALAVMIAC